MSTAENGTTPSPPEQLAALRAGARTTSHDAKNAVGIIWMHLASLERRIDAAQPETREAIDGIKEETRQIVKLLDSLSQQARG